MKIKINKGDIMGYVPWNKGKTYSEEHKRKISEANKGRKFSEEHMRKISESNKGRIPWNKSKRGVYSEGVRKRMSDGHKGLPSWNKGLIGFSKGHIVSEESIKKQMETKKKRDKIYSGEKHPNWLGGKSFEPYGVEFNKKLKEQIKKRDGYRCQECFRHQDELKKGKLNVHHIDFNKKNNTLLNLISLCPSCHMQTNFNRDNWTNYFENVISQRGLK